MMVSENLDIPNWNVKMEVRFAKWSNQMFCLRKRSGLWWETKALLNPAVNGKVVILPKDLDRLEADPPERIDLVQ